MLLIGHLLIDLLLLFFLIHLLKLAEFINLWGVISFCVMRWAATLLYIMFEISRWSLISIHFLIIFWLNILKFIHKLTVVILFGILLFIRLEFILFINNCIIMDLIILILMIKRIYFVLTYIFQIILVEALNNLSIIWRLATFSHNLIWT